MGDLLVQAGKLPVALDALDTADFIARGAAFRIGRTDIAHRFRAVFIFPAIHYLSPFRKADTSGKQQ